MHSYYLFFSYALAPFLQETVRNILFMNFPEMLRLIPSLGVSYTVVHNVWVQEIGRIRLWLRGFPFINTSQLNRHYSYGMDE